MDPQREQVRDERRRERERDAVAAGRRWADDKAAALDGVSPRDWPQTWDDAWRGELRFDPHLPRLTPGELRDLLELASDSARVLWIEIVDRELAIEARGVEVESESYSLALFEELRNHVPQGLTVGREGTRVYVQDLTDGRETAVTSFADAVRAISDWQERHFGR